MTRALLLSLLAAVVLTGTSGTWGPTWMQVGGPVLAAVIYVALGRSAGWWALPTASVALIAIGASASALFYNDQAGVPPDQRLSGLDQMGADPGSVGLLLPIVWVVLLMAILSRRRPRALRAAEAA